MAEDRRLIDHSPDVALTLSIQWATAVRAQAKRVTEGTGTDEQIPDAYLLVIALRNVRRAAQLAIQTFDTPAARDQLTEALNEFDETLPGAADTRDAIEHFYDYTRGIGNQQQSGSAPSASLTRTWLARMCRTSGSPTFHVGRNAPP